MRLSFNRLVGLVLFAVTLVFILVITRGLAQSADGLSDTTCMTSVSARIAAVSAGLDGARAELRGCEPRIREVDGWSDRKLRGQIADDYLWCYHSYQAGGDHVLLGSTDTFCRVCALYLGDREPLPGAFPAIEEHSGGLIDFGGEVREEDVQIGFPTAIIFVQTRDDGWTSRFFGSSPTNALGFGGGAAVLAFLGPVGWVGGTLVVGAATVGGVLLAHTVQSDADVTSNIFITAYDADGLDALDCTTTRLDAG